MSQVLKGSCIDVQLQRRIQLSLVDPLNFLVFAVVTTISMLMLHVMINVSVHQCYEMQIDFCRKLDD